MRIKAHYFDGKISTPHDVEVHLRDDGGIEVTGEGVARVDRMATTRVSERIGNIPRRLFFGDGATCELRANDELDSWLEKTDGQSFEHRVFKLERLWGFALGALVLTGLAVWLGIRFGVPALANHAAAVLPTSVDTKLGQEGLRILDSAFFEPSTLPVERQAEIRERFNRIVADAPPTHDYRLEFRAGGKIGANALALPSGIIVMTDELVKLAEDDLEITAVLAHEVGHVVHRHALRSLIQTSTTAALMAGLLGDATSISALIASTPTVLLQAKFSRELESEADDFSYAWLKRHDIPTHYFGDLLQRLSKEHGGSNDFSYFSSHPSAEDRIRE
ncbi:MAG TPA: M48 family metallopeptidase [Steroidobacteraceae bacterium]|nr:M48 family metallopeptidase [Steroidobacteraceae bacterium]